MCGIIGYITEEGFVGQQVRAKFATQALIFDSVRGMDSTGVFTQPLKLLREGDTAYWTKRLGPGYEFVNSKEGLKVLSPTLDARFLVGHNRAATAGKVTVDNAHPFQEGPITLVHNGTLWDTAQLPQTQQELKVAVDSHAICHNLAIAAPEDVIPKLDGAFALVWHDARDDSLNVVRNSERPLHFARQKFQRTLYFMSEAAMLHMTMKRLDIERSEIFQPDPGVWLKFLPGSVDKPVIKKLDLMPPSTSYYGGYYTKPRKGGAASKKAKAVAPVNGNVGGSNSQPKSYDQILMDGVMVDVPENQQNYLLSRLLLIEDRLTFKAETWNECAGREKGYVDGHFTDRQQHRARIYGVYRQAFEESNKRSWRVRPIGMRCEGNQLVTLCKVVTYNVPKQATPSTQWVQGPYQQYIPPQEFLYLVSGGCVACGCVLTEADVDDITWQGDDPYCFDCYQDNLRSFGGV